MRKQFARFNRLLILAAVVWAFYWTVAFPMQQRGKALSRADFIDKAELDNCAKAAMRSSETERLNACWKQAEDAWE